MKRSDAAVAMLIAVLALSATTVRADSLDALPYALSGGTPNLDLRLRYETVNQDNLAETGDGLFARARLGYTTGKWNNLDAQLEYEGLTALGNEQFNSTNNGKTNYPVIADPAVNELNQAWVRYTGLPNTSIKVGRQRIIFDNARFIGNVGWRMNEQTFDGAMLTGTWIKKLTVNYAYIDNVNTFRYNTINGSNTNNIDLDGGHLANVDYAFKPWLDLVGYGYLLNFAYDAPVPPTAGATLNNVRRDNATYGLRATGTVPVAAVSGLKLKYALEYARQQAYADSPDSVKGFYELAELTALYQKASLTLGYELLSGNGNYGFQTPLATIHAFDGWDDQFLTTPATGLKRYYANFGYQIEKCSLNVVYHDFGPDADSSQHYGSEIDVQITRPVMKVFSIGAKYANYMADNGIPPAPRNKPVDVSKAWAWIEYKF